MISIQALKNIIVRNPHLNKKGANYDAESFLDIQKVHKKLLRMVQVLFIQCCEKAGEMSYNVSTVHVCKCKKFHSTFYSWK